MRAPISLALLTIALTGCEELEEFQGPHTGPPAAVEWLEPEAREAILGETDSEPLTVQVTDADGRPVPGIEVRFELDGGEGVVSPETAMTTAEGRAETSFTPYGFVGEIAIRASVEGLAAQVLPVQVTTRAEDLGGFDLRDTYIEDANDEGTLVGRASGNYDAGLYTRAVRWTQAGGLELLPNPVSDRAFVWANAVNAAGAIVGSGRTYDPDQSWPLVWQGEEGTGLPDGATDGGEAHDINSQGDVVGQVDGSAALWTNGELTLLSADFVGCEHWSAIARAINDEGEVVGNAPPPDKECDRDRRQTAERAVLWERPGLPPSYLPIPVADELATWGVAINGRGEVLVRVDEFNVIRTFFWSPEAGAIELESAGHASVEATTLNDSSWIGGRLDGMPAFWRAPDADPVLLPGLGQDDGEVTGITSDGWAVGYAVFFDEEACCDAYRHAARWRVFVPRP